MVTTAMKLKDAYSLEEKTNLDSILKSRDITLPTKVHLVKAMVFPVVMYGCESWTLKKAERQRIDGFELWCWRRFLSIPRTARIQLGRQLVLVLWSSEYLVVRGRGPICQASLPKIHGIQVLVTEYGTLCDLKHKAF